MPVPEKHRCAFCGQTVTDGAPQWLRTTTGTMVKWMCARCADGMAEARDLLADLASFND